MDYWGYAAPILQVVFYLIVVIFITAAMLVGVFGLIGIFMPASTLSGVDRMWWALAFLVGLVIAIFGVPYIFWLNSQWWPAKTVEMEVKSEPQMMQECIDKGYFLYTFKDEGSEEMQFVCSREELKLDK